MRNRASLPRCLSLVAPLVLLPAGAAGGSELNWSALGRGAPKVERSFAASEATRVAQRPSLPRPPAQKTPTVFDAPAPAQPTAPPEPSPPDRQNRALGNTSGEPPLRDPTQPSGRLEGVVGSLRMGQGTSRAAGAPGLPPVVLRGRIVGPLEPPAAMLEIDGQLYIVQQGSSLPVPSAAFGPGGLTLNITELNNSEVRIEIMPLRQEIVLR